MKINKYYIVLAISIFVFGLEISEDYGISWDEGIQRIRGQKALVFVANKLCLTNLKNIPNSLQDYNNIEASGKYGAGRYGAIFDLPTAIIEELFFADDLRL
ncbi:uncharacterized protein METZ01_LOCUS353129, partial [marine metagenome]